MKPRYTTLHISVSLAIVALVALCDVFSPYGLHLSHFYVVALVYLAWLVPGRTVWYITFIVAGLALAIPFLGGRDFSNRIDGTLVCVALTYAIWDRQRYARILNSSNIAMSGQIHEQVVTLQQLNFDLTRQVEERSQAEALLGDSEARYRNLVELSPDGIFVVQDGRLVFANEAAARVVRANSTSELLGRDVLELIDPIQRAVVLQRQRLLLASGKVLPPQEYHVRRLDGTWTDVEVLAGTCRFQNQLAIQVVVRDLTASKRLATDLRKLSDFREKVIATAAEGICVCSPISEFPFIHFSIWNGRMTEITGYTIEEINQIGLLRAIHPDLDDRHAARKFANHIWERTNILAKEESFARKDGTQRTVTVSASHVELEEGEIAAVALLHDITERKLAEEQLRESERRFRGLVEAIPDLIFRVDPLGTITYAKNEPADDLMVPANKLIGERYRDCLPSSIADQFDVAIATAVKSSRVQTLSYEMDFPDGRHQYFEARVVGFADGSAVVVARNDTERLQAVASLQESELRFRQMAENIREVFWIASPGNREIIYVSPAYEELVGRSCASLYANPMSWLESVHPEDRAGVESSLPEQAETGYDREYRIIRPDGAVRWVRDRTFPIHNEHGEVARIVGLAEDVTKRRQVEDELRENQERLHLAMQAASMGPWDWDMRTGAVVLSPESKQLLGYEDHEIASQSKDWRNRLHPEDRVTVLEALRIYLDGQRPEFAVEFRLRRKDWAWRWIYARGVALHDAEGMPTRMLGCYMDITARKRAEALLNGQKRVLELAAMGASLATSLNELTQVIENHAPGMLCSILLLSHDGQHLCHGAAPSLPPDYIAAIDGVTIGPSDGSCGTAAYRREPVFVKDIDTDPLWNTCKKFALPHGLRACWSTPILDAQNQVLGTFAMYYRHPALPTPEDRSLIDIATQTAAVVIGHHRMESSLRESEVRLRTLLEDLENVAVQAYEADGTITFWNRASERLYGFTAAEAMGRDIVALLHSEKTAELERRIMAEAIHTGQVPAAEEVEVVRKDGTRAQIIASRILHRRRDKPPEFFCFDVDITDRKRAEEELAARQSELLHASRLSTVGQMVAALSHEVAQPLTAIGNFAAASARLLASESLPPIDKLNEYVRAIGKQNERCSAILERLRNFSRRTPMCRSSHDINVILRESVDLVYNDLRRHYVETEFECADDLPPVLIDKIQIQQVLVNLLSNARDAVRNQPINRRLITVRSRLEEANVLVEIEDRGEGLPDGAPEQVFEPFFTTKEGGMGIGLSISQRIVREHGGEIAAVPNDHGGATFRISLPIRSTTPYQLTGEGG